MKKLTSVIMTTFAATLAAVFGALLLATEVAATIQPPTPILTSVEVLPNGQCRATFGYNNPAGVTGIPINDASDTNPVNNFFSPDPIDRGQPASLVIGSHPDVFTVDYAGESITWTLAFTSVTASAELCPGSLPLNDGNPIVTVGDNTNANDNDQGNNQEQNQDPDQDQDVDQDNDNTDTQDNAISGNAGALAESGCGATQGEDATGDDNTTCESGDATAGDSSTGNSTQANGGEQSGANSNSQEQTLTGGNQANAPESTTTQNASNELSDIGGDVDNSIDTDIDDHSDDDVTDNKEGELNQSQDNDGIEGDENQVNLVDDLLEQLGILLRLILNNLPPTEVME